jgi:hypothetical protein
MTNKYGPRITTDGLVLCLDAADQNSYPGTDISWYDLSGNGNDGTLQNDPTYNSNNFGSFALDGSNDRILISCNTSTIRTFNSTTQFVVKLPLYSGGQRCILSYRTGAGNLYIGKNNSQIFCYYNQLSSPSLVAGNILDNSTVIVHVVCDAENNLLSIYINGNLAGSASRTNWVSTYHTSLYLGWDAGGTNEYMLGNFYQFAHYDKVLNSLEIKNNHNALKGRYNL